MSDYGQRPAPGVVPSRPHAAPPPPPPPASGGKPQPSNAEMLAAIRELIAELRALREDLKPSSPGPARGLVTNVRSVKEHQHQVGPRMGFGTVNVEEEQQ